MFKTWRRADRNWILCLLCIIVIVFLSAAFFPGWRSPAIEASEIGGGGPAIKHFIYGELSGFYVIEYRGVEYFAGGRGGIVRVSP